MAEAIRPNEYGTKEDREAYLLARFLPPEEWILAELAVLIDAAGIILLWYLPEVLSDEFQVSGWATQ